MTISRSVDDLSESKGYNSVIERNRDITVMHELHVIAFNSNAAKLTHVLIKGTKFRNGDKMPRFIR
jgi:hypothetical protein